MRDMPGSGRESWTVLGDDLRPVEPVGLSGVGRGVAEHDQGLRPRPEGLVGLPRRAWARLAVRDTGGRGGVRGLATASARGA
jgi:hypothetical protein